jgi:histidyl-tRNA synthetase
VSEVLQTLGFADFVVQLNHRELLTALLEGAGVPVALHGEALIGIDKLDKIGRDKVADDLSARGIDPAAAQTCLRAFEDLGAFGALVSRSARGAAAQANLAAIMTYTEATPASGHVQFTPRLARGLSYYTGAIMEISVPDLAGSLGGGGRYDGLIGMFSGEQIPACGFSLGLERILVVMAERKMFDGLAASGADVLVTIFDDDLTAESLRLAAELRGADLRVELYPEPLRGGKDLGKAFKYADSRRARFVTVVGRDELERGEVKIKNLATGEQQAVARGDVAEAVRRASNVAPRTSNFGPRASDTE